MTSTTQQSVYQKTLLIARHQLAILGYEGISMRTLAQSIGIAPSVLYHYFADKDALLKEVYLETNRELGQLRAALPPTQHFDELLQQRIRFQFTHAESVVAVLKYYLHFRANFEQNERGHLPEKTYLHIEEVLEFGQKNDLYSIPNILEESKVIVHLINGFILEYFPSPITNEEEKHLVSLISDFILRALTPYRKGISL